MRPILEKAIRIQVDDTVASPTDFLHWYSGDSVDSSFVYDQGSSPINLTRRASLDIVTGWVGNAFRANSADVNPAVAASADSFFNYTIFSFNFLVYRDGATLTLPGGGSDADFLGILCDWQFRGLFLRTGNTGGLVMNVGNNVTFQTAGSITNAIRDQEWTMITFVYNNGTGSGNDASCKSYLNGVEVDNQTGLNNIVYDQVPGDFQFMGRNRVQECATNLIVDEWKYWNRELTPAEITALWDNYQVTHNVSISPQAIYETFEVSQPLTEVLTCNVSGGVGPFLYLWEFVQQTALEFTGPVDSSQQAVTVTGQQSSGTTYDQIRCRVQDTGNSNLEVSSTVIIQVTWSNPDGGGGNPYEPPYIEEEF